MSRLLGEDTLVVIDPTDMTKPYPRKMECLAEVRHVCVESPRRDGPAVQVQAAGHPAGP